MAEAGGLHRREFLQRGVAATVGIGAFAGALGAARAGASAAEAPGIRSYRKLGRTGLEISDVSFGTGDTKAADLVRYGFDHGINYFDTAESYPLFAGGQAELAIGRALQGVREKIVLATKTVAEAKDDRHVLMRRLEASLRRLRTDRVEIYFNHAVNDLERLRNPEWFEFVTKAKQQGKIRFSGMSGHGGVLLECLKAAVDEDLVDVFLAAHNFGQDPAFYERFTKHFDIVANQKGLPELMERAHAKGIGVIVMKTLMGAKINDMGPWQEDGATFAQAAFRWVLSNPDVDALVVSMKSREQIDEYLRASGSGAPREADVRLLSRYLALRGASYCRHGCGGCNDACPHGVPIAEVLRTRMYATHYGDVPSARASYARLSSGAEACLTCAERTCAGVCPYGLDVPGMTRSTPDVLGLG